MSSALEELLAIARRVVAQLAAHTELRASLLTGSVAQGTCDDRSDIDLLNYYERLPAREDFDRLLRMLGAEVKRELSAPGAPEFVAGYDVDGIELQTGAQLTPSLEAALDRIAAGEVDWATAKVAMGLQEGESLHGRELVEAWQGRIAYPEELRRREVEKGLGVFPIWSLGEYLATRDAALFQRQMLVEGAFRVVAVLSALNRLYFSTFQFKRMASHAARMPLKPERLAERLAVVADAPLDAAGEELSRLVGETKDLVRQAIPELDVEQPWRPPDRDPG